MSQSEHTVNHEQQQEDKAQVPDQSVPDKSQEPDQSVPDKSVPDQSVPDQSVPHEFKKICKDFLGDILNTFSEYKEEGQLNEDLSFIYKTNLEDIPDDDDHLVNIFNHCKNILPERFFDILYKNTKIFSVENESEIQTDFLPGIDFKLLWNDADISDNTRDVIWRYLQLIMFSIIEKIDHRESFGDTAKLFEAIDESELKTKIEEVMDQMKDVFDNPSNGEGINIDDMPDPESLHSHLNGVLDGKLGKLAHEIAEETAKEIDLDIDDESNVGDVFNKLFKNPGKLMGIVNNISKKLDNKLTSGEINEKELMEEASSLIGKMNNIPGMPNIQDLLKNLNIPHNKQGPMKQKMNQESRISNQRERLRKKLEQKQQAAMQQKLIQEQMAAMQQQMSAMQQQTQNIGNPVSHDNQFDGKTFKDGSTAKKSRVNNKKKKNKKK